MSSLRLELKQNPATGRHDLLVKLDSDRDLTTQEHEALHRSLVERLLGQGLLKIEELGDLKVERAGAGSAGGTGKSPSRQAATKGEPAHDHLNAPDRLAH